MPPALSEILSAVPLDVLVSRAHGDALVHLLAALVAGGAIGMERSYHGRPAGFRTHALVCLAASLLMLVTVYQAEWFRGAPETIRVDPTRMAQGIMTGIGFLGAGVIFKEGLTVRGLTTAASIWITSAIGVLTGTGQYVPALYATLLTLGVLSLFRWIEARAPAHKFAHHRIRFDRGEAMGEDAVRALLAENGFALAGLSYAVMDEGRSFEYRMTISTHDERNFGRLARALEGRAQVREFRISPSGD
ncbi:MgtC/SapB family protein [Anaeromyxobacter terrae]|uniref:MgtC/SapB family protein n=1 Tax=Anaeromyxobacter terrae TaxID=2925406 RepID=UPI001F570823|nr:MgtC/SapB family protein [Anaeromyxobacter sp. SG22]